MKIKSLFASIVTLVLFSAINLNAVSVKKIDFDYINPALDSNGIEEVIVVLKEVSGVGCQVSGKSFPSIQKIQKLLPDTLMKRTAESSEPSRAAKNLQNMYVAKIEKGKKISEVIKELNAMPEVKYAEPNYAIHLCVQTKANNNYRTFITSPLIPPASAGLRLQRGNPTFQPSNLPTFQRHRRRLSDSAAGFGPNDPLLNYQWYLNNTGQTYPTDSGSFTSGTPGADIGWLSSYEAGELPTNEIIIAVIDTGTDYTHVDITNRMWRNVDEIINGIDDDFNGYVDDVYGVDIANGDGNPLDDNGHGTHVSGTIAAETDNGIGVAGVCPGAKIMAIKVFDFSGSGASANGIAGIFYAANMGAQVINCSWGGAGPQQAMQDAITYANEQGCAVVCAAGNNGLNLKFFPAGYEGTTAIAATDSNDEKASFSNYGTFIDFCTPGEDILNLRAHGTYDGYEGNVPTLTSQYLMASGTSMASPVGAGAMGLLMLKRPGHQPWIYTKVISKTADTNIFSIGINTNITTKLGGGRLDIPAMFSYMSTNAFIEAYMEYPKAFSQEAGPGDTNLVHVKVGTWEFPVENVTVRARVLTDGITIKSQNYSLGNLSGFTTEKIPDGTFDVIVKEDAEFGSIQRVEFDLEVDGIVFETKKIAFKIFSGDVGEITVYDLDGDGSKEIIGVKYKALQVFDETGALKWYTTITAEGSLSPNIVGGPAVGDIDGDGKGEIVVVEKEYLWIMAYYSRIYVYEDDGTVKDGWPVDVTPYLGISYTQPPTLADLDNDGVMEIIVAGARGGYSKYAVFNSDGTYAIQKASSIEGRGPTQLTVGDINHDGSNEIVYIEYGNDKATVCIRDANLNLINSFEIEGDDNHFTKTPVLADIDFDGFSEIVVQGYIGDSIYLCVFNQKGDYMPGWPVLVKSWGAYYPVTTGDVDGDGDLEFFIFRSDTMQINGYDHIGNMLPDFPITDLNCASEAQLYYGDFQPLLADVDDDDFPEVVYIGGYEYSEEGEMPYSFVVTARDLDGLLVPGYPFTINGLDAPGQIPSYRYMLSGLSPNIFTTNQNILASIGSELFLIDTGKSFNENLQEWPAFAKDSFRSYNYVHSPGKLKGNLIADKTRGVNSLNVNFSSFVISANTNNLYYRWDFDNDGTVDAEGLYMDTAAHDYSSVGTYSVRLVLSNEAGEVYTAIREDYIRVSSDIAADFSAYPTNAVAPVRVDFTDLSLNYPGSWAWDFDNDGIIDSTEQNPQFLYTNAGVYSVTLTASNNFGFGESSGNSKTKIAYINISSVIPGVTNHYVSKTGKHIYPYKTWEEAATNIIAATTAATAGHNIIVNDGVYYEATYFTIEIGVSIWSVNGPLVTIIDCNYGKHGEVRVSVRDNATFTGFTVRNARNWVDGGMSTRGKVNDCIFINNQSTSEGFIVGAGGVSVRGNGILANSLVISNYSLIGGGVQIFDAGVVSNCHITGNRAGVDSAAVAAHTDGAVYNCLIDNNEGPSIVECSVGGDVYNTTITKNKIAGWPKRGALAFDPNLASKSEALNIISYDNDGANYYFEFSNPDVQSNLISIINSCVTPAITQLPFSNTIGTITTAPDFLNVGNENYRLNSASPCVDTGTNYVWGNYPEIRNFLFDLGVPGYTTPGNWNNITDVSNGVKIADAVDSSGSSSGISLEFIKPFDQQDSSGVLNNTLYPTTAQRDSLLIYATNEPVIKITGLVPANIYDFNFFASANDNYAYRCYIGNRESGFGMANNNISSSPTIQKVTSDSNGVMVINIETVWSNSYAALGVLEIIEYEDLVTPVNSQVDYDNKPRVFNEIVDIGCYEWDTNYSPVAKISVSPPSGNNPVTVTISGAGSTDPESAIVNYSYDFGDGSPVTNGATLTSVQHTFTAVGAYVVKLTVTDNTGQSSSDSAAINSLKPVPAAPSNFNAATTSATDVQLTWTDNSSDETGFVIERMDVAEYVDVIVDNTDTDKVVIEGTWETKTAADDYGINYFRARYKETQTRKVNYYPQLSVTGLYELFEWHPASTKAGTAVKIYVYTIDSDIRTYVNQQINGGQWNSMGNFVFDDAAYIQVLCSTLRYKHAFADAFRFVKIESWLFDTDLPADTELYDDNDMEIDMKYSWRIKATNEYGSSPWVEATLYLPTTNVMPVAVIDSVSPSSGSPNLEVTARGTGIDSDGTIINYKWNFGDGYSGSIQQDADLTNAVYTYKIIGEFTITLTVTDNSGYSAETNFPVSVFGAVPVAPTNLTVTVVNNNYAYVSWQDPSLVDEGLQLQRKIDSGSFSTIADLSANILYYTDNNVAQGSSYTYRVRSTNEFGNSDWSNEESVYLEIPPQADIISPASATSVVTETEVIFLGDAIAGDNAITNLQWNFGDESVLTNGGFELTNIVHTYTVEGMYTAVFTVADSGGFGAEDSVEIEVIPEGGIFWILNFGLWIIYSRRPLGPGSPLSL